MTEGGRREDGRGSVMARLSQAVAIATGMALLGTMACDTVARIPTEDRTFRNLHPVTISPHNAGEKGCGAIDGTGVLSMVFLDNDGQPIKPGEDVERSEVAMGGDDVEFDGGILYSLPDVDCSEEGDDLCSGDLRCGAISDVDGDRCQETSAVSTQSDPIFAGVEPESQAFAIAMADVGRWQGRYHDEFNTYYEFVEGGDNRPLDTIDSGVAVDEGGLRISALRDVVQAWRQLHNYVEPLGRDAYFGFWEFRDSAATVRSKIPGPSTWTQDPGTAREAIDSLNERVDWGRAGVYNALSEIVSTEAGFGPGSTVEMVEEKHLLFVVSGYDERQQMDVEDVIDEAISRNVSISVVQIDPALGEPDHVRDDEEYYRGQYSSPCGNANDGTADDSECAYHEICREPRRYADDEHTDDESDIVWPHPQSHDDGDKYCLPDYDSNGRIGPIEEYQRLACATGGSYSYVPDLNRTSIGQPMIAQLWAPEAAWEIDINIDGHPGRTEGGEAYMLETVLDVFIGRNQRFRFAPGSDVEADTREVFFTPTPDSQ